MPDDTIKMLKDSVLQPWCQLPSLEKDVSSSQHSQDDAQQESLDPFNKPQESSEATIASSSQVSRTHSSIIIIIIIIVSDRYLIMH